MKRRSFLAGILAASAAPAVITKSSILMPVKTIAFTERGFYWDPSEFDRNRELILSTNLCKEMISESTVDSSDVVVKPFSGVGRDLTSPAFYFFDETGFLKEGKPVYVASPPRGYPGRSFLL
jgi:hypothetical protein